MDVFNTRKNLLTEQLVENAGNAPLEDKYKTGYIAAINDLLNIQLEEIEDND